MKGFEDIAGKRDYILKPRFTTIYHPVRIELELNTNEYIVIDSIDQLSHNPGHEWCTQSKEEIADYTGIAERTVYRAINVGIEKELVIRDARGALQSTLKWIEAVRFYKEKTTRKHRDSG